MFQKKLRTYDVDLREELKVHLTARRDLGDRFDDQIIDALARTVERAVDQRVDARLRMARLASKTRHAADFAMAIVSIVMAIPLSAIAGEFAGLTGLLVVWAGLIGVNLIVWFGRRF